MFVAPYAILRLPAVDSSVLKRKYVSEVDPLGSALSSLSAPERNPEEVTTMA